MKRSSSAMKRVRDREKADPTPRPRPPPVPRRQSNICEGDGYGPIFEDQYSQTLLLPREIVRQRAVVIVPGNNLSERGADLQWEGRTRTRRRASLPANNLLNSKFFSRPKKIDQYLPNLLSADDSSAEILTQESPICRPVNNVYPCKFLVWSLHSAPRNKRALQVFLCRH